VKVLDNPLSFKKTYGLLIRFHPEKANGERAISEKLSPRSLKHVQKSGAADV